MKKDIWKRSGLGLIAGMILLANASLAMAHEDVRVNWAVQIGSPYPQPMYRPPVVYVAPGPVYVESAPVYVERVRPVARSFRYFPQPYYVEEIRYERRGRWHGQHHWHHD